ncbi:AlpA family transcriptional regulator [Bradyrhizobium sp. Bra64]|uniref:helix-turn-helix transcriptional regulator n=1 Tax=Bradyrhizobium sp. Bra64 TaxID=2926009 RepID=UPI00211924F0|nr:DNA-binding protein [Bradyrhizobium sp. Bra64]
MSTIETNVTGRKLPTKSVCARYGVCDRTIARWERDPDLSFPQPMLLNGRKYYDEAALADWDRAQIRGAA